MTGDGGRRARRPQPASATSSPACVSSGLTASGAAEVVAVELHGEAAATIVYRTTDGTVDQQVVLPPTCHS